MPRPTIAGLYSKCSDLRAAVTKAAVCSRVRHAGFACHGFQLDRKEVAACSRRDSHLSEPGADERQVRGQRMLSFWCAPLMSQLQATNVWTRHCRGAMHAQPSNSSHNPLGSAGCCVHAQSTHPWTDCSVSCVPDGLPCLGHCLLVFVCCRKLGGFSLVSVPAALLLPAAKVVIGAQVTKLCNTSRACLPTTCS